MTGKHNAFVADWWRLYMYSIDFVFTVQLRIGDGGIKIVGFKF